MGRKRPPFRIDDLLEAAKDVFVKQGFTKAKISEIARLARLSAGTVYLYAESKDALFEWTIRRALEDPGVMTIELPYPSPSRAELIERVGERIGVVGTLPALWLASEHSTVGDPALECETLFTEIWNWFARYRSAVLLLRTSAADWPGLSGHFEREFEKETRRRLTRYLTMRGEAGALTAGSLPHLTAGFILSSLAASALGLTTGGEIADRIPSGSDRKHAVNTILHGVIVVGGRSKEAL